MNCSACFTEAAHEQLLYFSIHSRALTPARLHFGRLHMFVLSLVVPTELTYCSPPIYKLESADLESGPLSSDFSHGSNRCQLEGMAPNINRTRQFPVRLCLALRPIRARHGARQSLASQTLHRYSTISHGHQAILMQCWKIGTSMWDCGQAKLTEARPAFTKSIAYKLSRDFSFSSFPGA